jgi:hypothetical protein
MKSPIRQADHLFQPSWHQAFCREAGFGLALLDQCLAQGTIEGGRKSGKARKGAERG